MAESHTGSSRPLSPHLQVYKFMFSMMMSISHRITGCALYFCSILLLILLGAVATGPEAYDFVSGWLRTFLGQLVLIGTTWCLMHHLLGGVRHLIWDTGWGFELNTVEWLFRSTLIGSLCLTGLVWLIVWFF